MVIVAAFREINLITGSLSKIRSDIKKHHSKWHNEACQIAGEIDAAIKKPRTNY